MFQYLQTIRDLMADGVTVILVTHHLHEIPPELNYVVTLSNGDVMHSGPKADILTREKLGKVFETDLQVVESGGWYQVLPA